MSTYRVTAKRWERGWELHVPGVGVTQTRLLAHAEQQVRDLVETMTDTDASDATVDVHVDLDGLEHAITQTRQHAAAAHAAQLAAAAETRDLVKALRVDKGLSLSDVATLLGVSRGRASQLSTPGAHS